MSFWKKFGLIAMCMILCLGGVGSGCTTVDSKTGDIYILGYWVGNLYWDSVYSSEFRMLLEPENVMWFGFTDSTSSKHEGTWSRDGSTFTGVVPSLDKQFAGTFGSNGQTLSGTIRTVGKDYDFSATKEEE